MKRGQTSPLAAYRSLTGLSLAALGERFQVNKSTVLRWERGDILIPVNKLPKIAAVTGISREKLRPDIFAGAA